MWIGVALLLLFIGCLIGLYWFFVYWTDRVLREAMAAADRESPTGWQLKDIEARRDRVSDADNAALVAMKVKSLLPPNWPMQKNDTDAGIEQTWDQRLGELPPVVQLDDRLLRGLRTSLTQVEPARAEARKLIGMTRGRFPLQWDDNIYLTKLSSPDARTSTNVLRYEATLASQDGDADRSMAFVRGMLGTARAVGDEPLLISALVRIGCDAQAVGALERTLAQGEPSMRELEAVQALLEKEAAEPVFLQAVRGERASMHTLLLSLKNGETDISELERLASPNPRPRPRKNFVDYLGPALARRSHAHILELMNQYVEAAKLPPEKQPPVMNDLEQNVRKAKVEWDIVTALVMPAMIRVSNANRRLIGNLRCAYVAVALERYRRDHGRWPDTLDTLVPKYLGAVPADPQDGKPLRFKQGPDGVVIYWVGPDGKDDGGQLNRLNYLAQGSDQGFQLWDVNQRRQPARERLSMPTPDSP
jgi:hypothetical protein